MEKSKAELAGVEAFLAGRPSAPALNQEFLKNACESSTPTLELLKAYCHGWTVANLAEPGFPSEKELIRITNQSTEKGA